MLKETEELIGIFGENFCDDDEYIEKSITLIVEYYMKNGRHSYSTISKIINSKLDQGEDSIIYILFNIAPLLQMGGKWQIITGSAIIRTLVERQALEELHEVNNHQEELGGSGYSSRETPNRQTQMNKN